VRPAQQCPDAIDALPDAGQRVPASAPRCATSALRMPDPSAGEQRSWHRDQAFCATAQSSSAARPPTIRPTTSAENPRASMKRICFARSARDRGADPKRRSHNARARSNSVCCSVATCSATASSLSPCARNSCRTTATPRVEARRCTTDCAKRSFDSSPVSMSRSSSACSCSGLSACGASLRSSSARLCSRRARARNARAFSVGSARERDIVPGRRR